MSLQPIPSEWRAAVVRLLRRGDPKQIRYTASGLQRWSNEFPYGERYQLEAAFRTVLERPDAKGCPVQMDYPPGTTWEFFFVFPREKLYGKILLRTNLDGLLILSAHRPERPTLKCE